MRDFLIEDKLQKKLIKIKKKDKVLFEAIFKKIDEIVSSNDVNHYKNLQNPMQQYKRVHVKSSFVLIFKYNESDDSVIFYNFDHHDNIYK